jgi:acyl-coenzyme A synthetase/AMP-(fatty) acid ligase
MFPLLTHHDPADLVAFGAGGERTAQQLREDVARVAAALPAAREGEHTLMVFDSDRYAFAVALLAAWARGYAVALPPNGRPKTITELLDRPDIDRVLHDTMAGGDHIHVPRTLDGPVQPPVELTIPSLPATMFTSGTTGDSTPWPKTYGQLLGEVEGLARTFAPGKGSRFVVTVPPAHLYGLLFGVLLPLWVGGAFGRETPLLPEAVGERVATENADVLVSVPIHLRAIQAVEPGRFASLRRVFSSTAPLDEIIARDFSSAHTIGITEIFGSTETGGVAWRRRNEGESWTPFEGVDTSIDEDGRLCVDSPLLPPDAPRPWRTADLAEPAPDGGFVHRGRADGVVKVGGRRVSLPHMQQWLLGQPDIDDAAVTSVPWPGRGVRILAALVASDLDEGTLRGRMLEAFAGSSLPRRFAFVPELPREASGKLRREALLALFGLRADGTAPSTQLEVSDPEEHADDAATTWTVGVHVPDDYLYFEGHFETYPILPGVVQLHELVLPLVAQARPKLGELQQLLKLKFLGRIKPGDDLAVTLRFPTGKTDCEFEIMAGSKRCSAGTLRFETKEASP